MIRDRRRLFQILYHDAVRLKQHSPLLFDGSPAPLEKAGRFSQAVSSSFLWHGTQHRALSVPCSIWGLGQAEKPILTAPHRKNFLKIVIMRIAEGHICETGARLDSGRFVLTR